MPANNFKLTGTRYVAKSGHDSAAGTADEPRKTISASGLTDGNIVIVGAGEYSGNLSGTNTVSISFQADGPVKLKNGSLLTRASYSRFHLYNVTFLITTNSSASFSGCTLENCITGTGSSNNSAFSFTGNSIILNCTISDNTAANRAVRVWYSVVHDSTIYMNLTNALGNSIQNSIITSTTIIEADQLTSANFFNNCCQGIIRISGVDYELKQDKAGNAVDPNPAIADLATATGWSDVYTRGNFNQDPLFNNIANYDFTLQATSPCVGAASDGTSTIGSKVGLAIYNSDHNGGTTIVAPSAQIDTSIPDAYKLNAGQTEGYVDYVRYLGGFTLDELRVLDNFNFDTDSAGGTVSNNNVVDSQPLTVDYAKKTSTTTVGSTTTFVVAATANVQIGDYVRINGQVRTVTGKANAGANDTLTVGVAFAATINSGATVTYGTEAQIAALTPNRLTVLVRTRSLAVAPSFPLVDSEWDNEVSAAYGVAGQFFHQEINQKPGLIIDSSNIYGKGDSTAPTGIVAQDLAPMWMHVRVYKRNNYSSSGI